MRSSLLQVHVHLEDAEWVGPDETYVMTVPRGTGASTIQQLHTPQALHTPHAADTPAVLPHTHPPSPPITLPCPAQAVCKAALAAGASAAVVCRHHAEGGAGALDLGRAVMAACNEPKDFQFLYDADLPIKVRHPVTLFQPHRTMLRSVPSPLAPTSSAHALLACMQHTRRFIACFACAHIVPIGQDRAHCHPHLWRCRRELLPGS
jgi:hypothetical protein